MYPPISTVKLLEVKAHVYMYLSRMTRIDLTVSVSLISRARVSGHMTPIKLLID